MLIKLGLFRKIILEVLDQNSGPVWIMPALADEIEELERTAEEENLPLDLLLDAFKKAKLVLLDYDKWSTMINSDTNDPMTLDDARQHANDYGRDIERVIKGFKTGSDIPAPIILVLPNGLLYGVAGNTRLMVSRAFNVQPKVLMLRPDYVNN